jgi:hypothetical protein
MKRRPHETRVEAFDRQERRFVWLAIGSMVALMLLIGACFARDPDGRYAGSPLRSWFDHLASGKGLCCSMADGETVADPDWESKDGHYRVRLPTTIDYSDPEKPVQQFEWIDVPDDALITEPNLFGRTMVWPVRLNPGQEPHILIRCFMPGSMT